MRKEFLKTASAAEATKKMDSKALCLQEIIDEKSIYESRPDFTAIVVDRYNQVEKEDNPHHKNDAVKTAKNIRLNSLRYEFIKVLSPLTSFVRFDNNRPTVFENRIGVRLQLAQKITLQKTYELRASIAHPERRSGVGIGDMSRIVFHFRRDISDLLNNDNVNKYFIRIANDILATEDKVGKKAEQSAVVLTQKDIEQARDYFELRALSYSLDVLRDSLEVGDAQHNWAVERRNFLAHGQVIVANLTNEQKAMRGTPAIGVISTIVDDLSPEGWEAKLANLRSEQAAARGR